jgi:small subunit ribosomal protein S6
MTTEVHNDPKRASDYETVFILRADIDSETSEKVISRAVAAIESSGGRLTKVESWGKRRLAYPIGKQRKGFYLYIRYLGYKGTVTELERNLRMLDTVLRHMSVLISKDIDFAAVEVDPEEIKVRRIEITEGEDDREESFESQLGLSDDSPRDNRREPAPPEPVEPVETADDTAAAPAAAGDA